MVRLCFLLIFFISSDLLSSEIVFSYKGVEHKSYKKNIIHLENKLDHDILAQVWKDNRLSRTLKVSKNTDKTYKIKNNGAIYIMGIKPPTRKILIRK